MHTTDCWLRAGLRHTTDCYIIKGIYHTTDSYLRAGLRYISWHDSWHKPLDDIRNEVRWQVCSPKTAQRFSAVPYLYGMFLHRYLKVPVGIINVARGGTLGQAW